MEIGEDYDRLLLGATREGLFQQLLFGSLPEQVGQRATCPVMMAKKNVGITSRLKRWFTGWNG